MSDPCSYATCKNSKSYLHIQYNIRSDIGVINNMLHVLFCFFIVLNVLENKLIPLHSLKYHRCSADMANCVNQTYQLCVIQRLLGNTGGFWQVRLISLVSIAMKFRVVPFMLNWCRAALLLPVIIQSHQPYQRSL